MSLRNQAIANSINLLLAALSRTTDEKKFRWTYTQIARLATLLARKDYYVERINWIRDLFDQNHPSLEVTKKILYRTNPHHRKTIIQTFIINQLLVGTNKRKAFSETEGGFYPPGFLVISPTMQCNLKCFGCYAGSYDRKAELPIAYIHKALDEAKEMGMYFCVVSGGEPFFKKDIFEIFERHKDMIFQVYTHGGLIDEALAERIARSGNIIPAISLEGFQEETDKRRGPGHFERVLKAMKMLKDAGIIFGFSATQTRENHETITSRAFMEFLIEQGCLLGWFFMYVPVGREPNIYLMPTPEQRDGLREWVGTVRATLPILVADFWNDGPVVGGCISGGRKYFHINARGDVEPCVFCHFAMHNIKNHSLKEALNSPLFKAIRAQQPFHENLLRPCMLVDKPELGRKMALETGAYFTHPGAEIIFSDLAPEMDRFAQSYARLADTAWETLYPKKED
jgi:MoaA/NifB/PqqE/SkfB family radical SAM enzyme